MTKLDSFDLESVYDRDVAPLMAKIIAICQGHKMPMIASFCYARGRDAGDPGGLGLCTSYVPRSTDDTIPEFVQALRAIRNGADTRPRAVAMTITSVDDLVKVTSHHL
jgi:hypothetical protein